MYGDIRDYAGLLARLDFHHVGILTREAPAGIIWDAEGYLSHFRCRCYVRGKFEYVVPEGGHLLSRLNEQGERLHHVALSTPNLRVTTEDVRAGGFHTLYADPVPGVGGMLVNFILPEGRGVLVELVQPPAHPIPLITRAWR